MISAVRQLDRQPSRSIESAVISTETKTLAYSSSFSDAGQYYVIVINKDSIGGEFTVTMSKMNNNSIDRMRR